MKIRFLYTLVFVFIYLFLEKISIPFIKVVGTDISNIRFFDNGFLIFTIVNLFYPLIMFFSPYLKKIYQQGPAGNEKNRKIIYFLNVFFVLMLSLFRANMFIKHPFVYQISINQFFFIVIYLLISCINVVFLQWFSIITSELGFGSGISNAFSISLILQYQNVISNLFIDKDIKSICFYFVLLYVIFFFESIRIQCKLILPRFYSFNTYFSSKEKQFDNTAYIEKRANLPIKINLNSASAIILGLIFNNYIEIFFEERSKKAVVFILLCILHILSNFYSLYKSENLQNYLLHNEGFLKNNLPGEHLFYTFIILIIFFSVLSALFSFFILYGIEFLIVFFKLANIFVGRKPIFLLITSTIVELNKHLFAFLRFRKILQNNNQII